MNLLNITAAAAAPAGQGNQLMSFIPLILIFIVMMFFMSRSQKKQQQKRQEMLDRIVKGSRVLLQSGMMGTVTEVKEKSFLVEIADKVVVEVVTNGVADLVETTEENKQA
ncbi:MAG: preprotein translocase subunit YajC [Lentisphaeria bacterium]|nr:preprotein translocase subunit YajC [Lentisphaeria bacterium]